MARQSLVLLVALAPVLVAVAAVEVSCLAIIFVAFELWLAPGTSLRNRRAQRGEATMDGPVYTWYQSQELQSTEIILDFSPERKIVAKRVSLL